MDEESPDIEAPIALRLIDTHMHLDDPAFAQDRDAVLAASIAAGVTAWVNVGYAPARWRSTIALSSATPGMAHMLGLHPQEAEEWSAGTARELESLLIATGARAIGEIGLDYAPHAGDHARQRSVFTDQLALAERLGLPIVIHMRDAERDLVSALRSLAPAHPVLLHCFDGTRDLLGLALERGYLIGVGGLATRARSAGLRALLTEVPLERMVLETDSPYLVPARQKDRRNQPANIALIADFLAALSGQARATVARVTSANAERFFGPLPPATGTRL